MVKKIKRRQFTQSGFEINDDEQRAKAEAIAKKGWCDDKDIVVDKDFSARLRAKIERLRERAKVPPNLLYKTTIRARVAHARDEFSKRGPRFIKALAAARTLCKAMEDLGAAPNVYWRDHNDVELFRKVIGELPTLRRLRDEIEELIAQAGNFKGKAGRPRDYEKPEFQRMMVSLLPDDLQRNRRRMDKEFADLYEMVSGKKENPGSYRRTRRARSAYAHKNPSSLFPR